VNQKSNHSSPKTQHTLGHINCPACEALRRTILEIADGKAISFLAAAEAWQQVKNQEVSAGTARHYEACLRPLRAFFGEMSLRDIHIGHITAYRKQRMEPRVVEDRVYSVGPSHINQEISALSQILDRAGLWAPIARTYKPMRKPRGGPGQRIDLEELRYLFQVAQKKPRWRVAYLVSLISANTAAGPNEILSLRLRDLHFHERIVTFVQGTKRDGERVRSIPMTDDCLWALQELEAMAIEKGAHEPDHHLLPHRAKVKGAAPDPTRHQTHYRKGWDGLRREAAKKYPRLARVRRYDLRHTALTMMCEDPDVDLPTLKKIAGHGPGSRLIIDHYFHENVRRKRVAVRSLDGLREPVPPPPPPKKEPRSEEDSERLRKSATQSRFLN